MPRRTAERGHTKGRVCVVTPSVVTMVMFASPTRGAAALPAAIIRGDCYRGGGTACRLLAGGGAGG